MVRTDGSFNGSDQLAFSGLDLSVLSKVRISWFSQVWIPSVLSKVRINWLSSGLDLLVLSKVRISWFSQVWIFWFFQRFGSVGLSGLDLSLGRVKLKGVNACLMM